MNRLLSLGMMTATLVLMGCDESHVYVKHVDTSPPHRGSDFVPHLKTFNIIDSYGVDTALDPGVPLTLDPYVDAGIFEIDWQVNSLEDYQISFRLNDRPSLSGSYGVYTEVCGEGLPCDQEAIRICQYYSDLTMACGLDDYVTDVSPLIYELPEKLYAVLEICDLDSEYCEYDYYPVWLE